MKHYVLGVLVIFIWKGLSIQKPVRLNQIEKTMDQIAFVQASCVKSLVLVNLHFALQPSHFKQFNDVIINKLKEAETVSQH